MSSPAINDDGDVVISRQRSAIRRYGCSRPTALAFASGVLSPERSLLDYGCGHGQDIELLAAEGIACNGWDPAFRPDAPKHPADVVNLGFSGNGQSDLEVADLINEIDAACYVNDW